MLALRPTAPPIDAETTAAFLLDRVRAARGALWDEGRARVAAPAEPSGPSLRVFADRRVRGVPEEVVRGLFAWDRGLRPVELLFEIPTAMGVLGRQARALATPAMAALERTLDDGWRAERDYVISDMNGSAVFLFAALKMKVNMAVRRRLARERGRPAPTRGPLDADERAAVEPALAVLFEAMELPADLREGAAAVSTRRDRPAEARRLLRHFEDVGRSELDESQSSHATGSDVLEIRIARQDRQIVGEGRRGNQEIQRLHTDPSPAEQIAEVAGLLPEPRRLRDHRTCGQIAEDSRAIGGGETSS